MTSILGEYKLLKTLGNGSYGKVKLALHIVDEKEYAVKIIKCKNPKLGTKTDDKTFLKEVSMMASFKHPNIVNLKEFGSGTVVKKNGETYDAFYIVMNIAKYGDLMHFTKDGLFTERIARYFFKQLISGISEIHKANIFHRDLKPGNLLLDEDFTLLIADFGFAKELKKGQHLETKLGTDGFKAPEIEMDKIAQYDGALTDIFSCGVILFLLLNVCPPFDKAKPNNRVYKYIIDRKYDQFWKFHEQHRNGDPFSEELKDLLNHIFEYEPSHRYTIDKIIEHPWYLGETPTLEEITQEFTERTNCIKQVLQLKNQAEIQSSSTMRTRTYRGNGTNVDYENGDEIIERALTNYVPSPFNTSLMAIYENRVDDIFNKIHTILMGIMELQFKTSDTKYKVAVALDKNEDEIKEVIIKLYLSEEQDTVVEFISNNCDRLSYYNFFEKINLLLNDERDKYDQLIEEEEERQQFEEDQEENLDEQPSN